MLNRILIICGPTATGKTKLAIKLAKKFNGEIVSADSRQVYKDFDIGTGKDIPPKAKFSKSKVQSSIGYYQIEGVKLWGYDLITPNEDFSVSNYKNAAENIIDNIYKRNKLPIIVGGTGLYINALTKNIETISIPKDETLRKSLDNKSADELFEILAVEDPVRAARMNVSDKKNPRRLVRTIEVVKHNNLIVEKKVKPLLFNEVLKICLFSDKRTLYKRIENRVEKRLKRGFENEFVRLSKIYPLNSKAFSSLGYRQWIEYYKSEITKKEAISKWIKEEQKYAKRQMTWFKKDKETNWFDITESKFPKNVEKLVAEWYTIN